MSIHFGRFIRTVIAPIAKTALAAEVPFLAPFLVNSMAGTPSGRDPDAEAPFTELPLKVQMAQAFALRRGAQGVDENYDDLAARIQPYRDDSEEASYDASGDVGDVIEEEFG